jgi:NAD(P)-dependent dehydrogenase (short-subunit alcohol dehydrogenase family)
MSERGHFACEPTKRYLGIFRDMRESHPCIGTRGQSLEKVTEEEWHEFIDGILSNVFYMSKQVTRHMIARGQGGVIINVSSINAYVIPNLTPR